MTFNILRDSWGRIGYTPWESRRDGVLNLLSEQNPAVIGLQEETPDQVAFITNALPQYVYPLQHHKNGSGFLIRTDIWRVVESGRIDIPSDRQASWLQLELLGTGQKWAVYNVHFMHDSASNRMKAAEIISRHMAGRTPESMPVVLLGDFNAQDSHPSMQYLYGSSGSPVRLTNAFTAIHDDNDQRGTTHAFTGKAHVPRIDHILVNSCVEILDADILQQGSGSIYPSDHYPVVATLRAGLMSEKQ